MSSFADQCATAPDVKHVESGDPLVMVLACHDEGRHFARLLRRLAAHVAECGGDAEAAHAAVSILHYFDHKAPLHHLDEEQYLFPALRTLGDTLIDAALDAGEADHEDLIRLWQTLRPWLQAIERYEHADAPPVLDQFAARYVQHAECEEAEVYAALALLPDKMLVGIARNMRARREHCQS